MKPYDKNIKKDSGKAIGSDGNITGRDAGSVIDDEPELTADDPAVWPSLYIDGEAEYIDCEAGGDSAGGSEFKRDLADFKTIRSGVQQWFTSLEIQTEKVVSARADSLDLWSKIESAIKADQVQAALAQKIVPPSHSISFETFLKRADRFIGHIFGFGANTGTGHLWSWRDIVAYGSSIGAVAVVLLLLLNSSFSNSNPSQLNFQANSASSKSDVTDSATVVARNEQEPVVAVARNGFIQGSLSGVFNHNDDNRNGINPAAQDGIHDVSLQNGGTPAEGPRFSSSAGSLVSREIQIDRLLQRARLASVLRTDGADIEWIRSDHGFNLMPSANGKAPPTIWVARWAPSH